MAEGAVDEFGAGVGIEQHDADVDHHRRELGAGLVMGGDEYQTCPGCRLRSRREERIREAHEDQVEAAYKEVYGPDVSGLSVYSVEGR